MTNPIVFQDWMLKLTMQQQSVLVLACRGPDGVAKYHPCKEIVARYRASVLKAAYLGRAMKVDEGDDTTFMTMRYFSDDKHWDIMCGLYFDSVDSLPHHYHMHLMHGAQIIGYKHKSVTISKRWYNFYHRACQDLHLQPETEWAMDKRLSDWEQKFWDAAE